MIFGKTWRQKQDEDQAYLRSIKDGIKWFAWYPVQLEDESWAWLEWVKKDYFVYEYNGILIKALDPVYYLWEDKCLGKQCKSGMRKVGILPKGRSENSDMAEEWERELDQLFELSSW